VSISIAEEAIIRIELLIAGWLLAAGSAAAQTAAQTARAGTGLRRAHMVEQRGRMRRQRRRPGPRRAHMHGLPGAEEAPSDLPLFEPHHALRHQP
jgi:hypothetical protein